MTCSCCELEARVARLEAAMRTRTGIAFEKGIPSSIERIVQVVAEEWEVSAHDILGTRRTKTVAIARHVAMYLARLENGRSLKETGAWFGGRDHTTVMYSVGKVKELRKSDPELEERLGRVLDVLDGGES